MTRQSLQQKANVAAGRCQFHKDRPIYRASDCKECWDKDRAKYRAKSLALGFKQHLGKAAWDKVDFSKGVAAIAKELGVSESAVSLQARRRGWRQVWTRVQPEEKP